MGSLKMQRASTATSRLSKPSLRNLPGRHLVPSDHRRNPINRRATLIMFLRDKSETPRAGLCFFRNERSSLKKGNIFQKTDMTQRLKQTPRLTKSAHGKTPRFSRGYPGPQMIQCHQWRKGPQRQPWQGVRAVPYAFAETAVPPPDSLFPDHLRYICCQVDPMSALGETLIRPALTRYNIP